MKIFKYMNLTEIIEAREIHQIKILRSSGKQRFEELLSSSSSRYSANTIVENKNLRMYAPCKDRAERS